MRRALTPEVAVTTAMAAAAFLVAAWGLPREAPSLALALGAAAVVALRGSAPAALGAGTVLLLVGQVVVDPAVDAYDGWIIIPVVSTAWALGTMRLLPRVLGALLLGAASSGGALADALFVSVLCIGLAQLAGARASTRTRAQEATDLFAEVSSRSPEDVAARAVADERSRIAADVQAVVRRSLLRMRGHAVAARDDPGAAEENLLQTEQEGRTTIAEMRRLLGLLTGEARRPQGEPALSAEDGHSELPWIGGSLISHPLVGWVLLGLGSALLAVIEVVWYDRLGEQVGPATLVLTVVAAGSVALGGSAPWLGCVVLGAAFAAGALLGSPVIGGFWFLASGGTLIWRTATTSSRAPIILPALVLVLGVSTASVDPDNAPMIVAISGLVAIVGLGWAHTHQRAERVEARAAQVVGAQQVAARAAVSAERRRMSRELHDVLSHAITIMVVQSGAARALSLTDPVGSRAAIDEVITTADRALIEVDVLGRLIEAGAAGTAGLGPGETTRTEQDLADLVDRMRAAGLDVVVDDPDSVSGAVSRAVGLCVYRVAQEGLTNVLRHAPGARVVLRLRIIDNHLEVTVDDDGGAGGSPPEPTSHRGFGLVGLGERVTALGGTLHTAALSPRGFQVAAHVPLTGAATVVMR